MDGNGRWAAERGEPRVRGHERGADAVRRTVEAAPGLGITHLTLYAFSSDNWNRPAGEVDALMRLFLRFLRNERQRCQSQGVQLEVIGRRDRLAPDLQKEIADTTAATARGSRLRLSIAIDYSSRDLLVRAARLLDANDASPRSYASLLAQVAGTSEPLPDLDLLIRTGREKRISDFLLWEAAYAELYFTDRMWPDFSESELKTAVQDYLRRERRFGRVPDPQDDDVHAAV